MTVSAEGLGALSTLVDLSVVEYDLDGNPCAKLQLPIEFGDQIERPPRVSDVGVCGTTDCDEMTLLGAELSKRTAAAAKRRRSSRSFRDMRVHARLATRSRYRPTRGDADRRSASPDRGLYLKILG
jgi:hypothetical protein